MYSVVFTSATAPFHADVALMPNRLLALVPSAFLICWRPQPVSCAACAIMKLAGMPVSRSAALAAADCSRTKLVDADAPFGALTADGPGSAAAGHGVAVGRSVGIGVAPPAGSVECAGSPIWRSSWRAIAALSPPGRPVILVASCVSSISVPICVPELSSMPDDSVAWRMLFISCCMNNDSNCLAASCTAAFGSRAALARNASMPRVSLASEPAEDELSGAPRFMSVVRGRPKALTRPLGGQERSDVGVVHPVVRGRPKALSAKPGGKGAAT